MERLTLVTGGAKSGKSRHALELASTCSRKAFIATAQAFDDEMDERIRRHKEERDSSFFTIEEPLDLAQALLSVPDESEIVLIDCLTVWLGNVMHQNGSDLDSYPQIEAFLRELELFDRCPVIVVSNELGLGIVPDNPLSRKFRDVAGMINQRVANLADRVVFIVAGLPLVVKGEK